MNKLKQSVQNMAPPNISLTMSGLTMPGLTGSGVKVEEDAELEGHVEQLDALRSKLKALRDGVSKQSVFLQSEANAYRFGFVEKNVRENSLFIFYFRAFAKTFDSIPALRAERGPLNVILQRICEFSNLTASTASNLSERIQLIVAEPWLVILPFSPFLFFCLQNLLKRLFSFFFQSKLCEK